MPTYEREHQDREWDRENDWGRQGYGRERPEYERGRPRQGAGNERWEQEPERQGYRGRSQEGHEWEPPSYRRRQQYYPWGQQGQEGYFGKPPRRYEGIPGREWERPDYEGEWQGYSRGQQSRAGESSGYESEGRGYPWSPGWPMPGSPWEHRDYPPDQYKYGSRGWEGVTRGPHAGRGPKGYQRYDARIHEDICDRLTDHPAIEASEIEVEVKGCEVTLSGTVESRAVKHLVEAMAETVPGVRDIHNQLRVTQGEQSSGQTQARQEGQKGRTTT
jgi:hypothetical protein